MLSIWEIAHLHIETIIFDSNPTTIKFIERTLGYIYSRSNKNHSTATKKFYLIAKDPCYGCVLSIIAL